MRNLFSALRIKEIIGKAGFFMVGVLFAEPPLTISNIVTSLHFFAICIVNGIAIYLLNAALGFHHDKTNDRLGDIRHFNKSRLLSLGVSIGVVGFVWLYVFCSKLVLPAAIVYALWIIYSFPKGLKQIPLLGLMIAFAGQLVHFHLGYLVFDKFGIESVMIASYFSFLFMAGHALHEVIDHDADQQAGLKTSAVFFGREVLSRGSMFLFVTAAFYLFAIWFLGVVSWTIMIPYEVAFMVHIFLYRQLPDTTNDSLFVYRRKYMLVYAAATVVVAVLMNVELG